MRPEVFLAALLGAGAGLGLMLALSGLRETEPAEQSGGRTSSVWSRRIKVILSQRRLVAGALAGGAVVGALTGWPVGAFLTVIAVLLVPQVVRPDGGAKQRTARIEAVAVWAEMLRDTLAAAAGLEQAIRATAESPPPALAVEIRALAQRIESGERTGDALRRFSDDVDDPTADLVVVALVLAAERQARQLAALLGSLAEAAREQVVMRLKVDAERARVRTSVRVVVMVSLAMATGLVLLNRGYLQPFDSAAGQLVLAVIGGLFGAAFAWMARIARLDAPPRLFAASTEGATPAEESWIS